MKTLKKRHSRTITTYVCDGCGKESRYMEDIDRCEATHKCKHSYVYQYWFSSDDMPGHIEKQCAICMNIEGRMNISELEDRPDVAEIVYNMMRI